MNSYTFPRPTSNSNREVLSTLSGADIVTGLLRTSTGCFLGAHSPAKFSFIVVAMEEICEIYKLLSSLQYTTYCRNLVVTSDKHGIFM